MITSRTIFEKPFDDGRVFATQLQIQQLASLRSNLSSATSRVRVLSVAGDQQDQFELAEAIARCEQSLSDLESSENRFGQLKDNIADFLELLRSANDDSKSIGSELLSQIRQQSTSLRSRVELLEERSRQNVQSMEDALVSKHRFAFWMAMGGHLLILAACASLLFAHRIENRQASAKSNGPIDSDHRFALVAQSSTDGVIVTDELGRIEVANSTMAKLIGITAENLTERALTDFFETTLIDEWLTNSLDGHISPALLVRRVRARRADGTAFLAELSATETSTDGIERLAISVRDVSEQEASRLRMKRHEALLEEIPDPIHVLDNAGCIVYWNRGATQLFGFDAAEAIGKTASDLLGIIVPEHETDNVHASDYATAQRWSGELQAIAKDGTCLRIERRRTRLFENGESIGDVIIDLDLVARTRFHQVERRRQRLESLGTLASGIAHDLNNLLTPILMSGKMLQRNSPTVDRDGLAQTIVSGASRGADLISQLLTFARGGEGLHHAIGLQEFLPEIVAILERTLPGGIRLTFNLESDLPNIFCDETEISQVVMNLAINARDSMAETGDLVIEANHLTLVTERSFSHTTLQPGDYVVISVSDTGTGIPLAIRDRIFDPFFSTKQRGQGTGLGLSTSIGITRSHGGAIGLQSTVGKGTTVSVILPAHQPEID